MNYSTIGSFYYVYTAVKNYAYAPAYLFNFKCFEVKLATQDSQMVNNAVYKEYILKHSKI